MPPLFDLVICLLAIVGILRIWFHGSIFAEARAFLETSVNIPGLEGWFARLMTCPLCLSVHVALLVVIIGIVIPYCFPVTELVLKSLICVPALSCLALVISYGIDKLVQSPPNST